MNPNNVMDKMKNLVLSCLMFIFVFPAFSDTLIVEKKRFTIDQFHTFNGKMIEQVNVGWESYGTLNADKSNVILITHYFTGSSHAAGKYHPDDKTSGYWDSIIGPGKPLDTNHFFIISADTLANVAVHDPNVITTGPATTNPDTGKPYGLDFPVVTIRDFVNVQKALLDSLGIQKLHAVMGASMGSMQALDWASAYPDRVERMISVIGTAQTDAWTTLALEHWSLPIKLDPNWQQGNYYGQTAPLNGLAQSLMLITQQALYPDFINLQHNQHKTLESAPLNDIRQQHQVVKWLHNAALNRAKTMDANHVLYLVRASQLFVAGHGDSLERGLRKIQAKSLFLPAKTDLLLMPYLAKIGHEQLKALGKSSLYEEIDGIQGHLDGVFNISQHSDTLRKFLQ